MEFNYKAVDERPPSPPPYGHPTTSSSGYSCFGQEAIKAGHRIPSSGGANDCFNEGFGQENEYNRNPIDVREEIQIELEKERIREEIIAAEIARRQALEAEVRREMMIERELALQARRGQVDALDRFSFPFGGGMEFEPRDVSFLHNKGLSLEERIAMSLEERLGMRERSETGRVGMVPFHHGSIEVMSSPADVKIDKNKIVIMAKPDASLSEAKQKAVPPEEEGASDLSGGVSKKRVKEKWSCALCQVKALSERDLNYHIQGKKHKSKEAVLRAQRNGNIGIGTFPKKDIKKKAVPPGAEGASDLSGGVSKKKVKEKWSCALCHVRALSERDLNCHIQGKKHKSKEAVLRAQRNGNIGIGTFPKKDIKKKAVPPGAEGASDLSGGVSKKKVKEIWSCALCHVRALSERDLNCHIQGKKHKSKEAVFRAERNGNIGIGTFPKKDIKKKAVPPEAEAASDLSGGVSKKKVKEKWSCALCQVTASSERNLNDHIQGKKHKSKEAVLRAQTNVAFYHIRQNSNSDVFNFQLDQ